MPHGFGKGARMAVTNAASAVDDEGLRHAGYSQINSRPPALVITYAHEWTLVRFEPATSVPPAFFPADAVNRYRPFLAKLHQQRMLNAAAGTPRCKNIEQRDPPLEI